MARGGKREGAGRKSAYQELAEATEAHRLFYTEFDQAEIEAKITSGKFSIADRVALTGMEGDTTVISTLLKKVLPDLAKIDHTTNGKELPTPLMHVPNNDGDK